MCSGSGERRNLDETMPRRLKRRQTVLKGEIRQCHRSSSGTIMGLEEGRRSNVRKLNGWLKWASFSIAIF